MFKLERNDLEVLQGPRGRSIDCGGTIPFVEAPGLGIAGTCAVRKTGDDSGSRYERCDVAMRYWGKPNG